MYCQVKWSQLIVCEAGQSRPLSLSDLPDNGSFSFDLLRRNFLLGTVKNQTLLMFAPIPDAQRFKLVTGHGYPQINVSEIIISQKAGSYSTYLSNVSVILAHRYVGFTDCHSPCHELIESTPKTFLPTLLPRPRSSLPQKWLFPFCY